MKYLLVVWFSIVFFTADGKNWYVSTTGDDDASGLSPSTAWKTILRGMQSAQPGDTLALLPGTYLGTNTLVDFHGVPDLPITIRSHSEDPQQFAIIDGQSAPSSEAVKEGFVLRECSWLTLEHLVFRNCWTHVIQLYDSPYITVRACHFSTGKRVIHAIGHGTHHTLVEFCYIRHPDGVWKGWSWESLHHGQVGYYNGALLHPNQSGGGHIMRFNTIVNMFNAFRTRPANVAEDGNIEIYANRMINIRDNEFEPESFAWNMHYYNNDHINVHKMYSIDGVQGGNIYIYGNTYTQTTDPWALEEISGIFKYKNGPITTPCYAFNNSYYTEAKVLRLGESTNHHLKHFNNAYEFFQGRDNFKLSAWQPGFAFDYDCINQSWPSVITEKWQERHGVSNTSPGFVDGAAGDFHLQETSPCRDAGKVMQLPEFGWIQSYQGAAPDIGAFEGDQRIDGPPFRFLPSPEGAIYQERPRISKYSVVGSQLRVFFSAPLDPTTLNRKQIELMSDGVKVENLSVDFHLDHYELRLTASEKLASDHLSLHWLVKPHGANGLPLTEWGSAMQAINDHAGIPDLSTIPIPDDPRNQIPHIHGVKLKIDPPRDAKPRNFRIIFTEPPDLKFVNHIAIYDQDQGELTFVYEPKVIGNEVHFQHPEVPLHSGTYIAKTRVGTRIIAEEFYVE